MKRVSQYRRKGRVAGVEFEVGSGNVFADVGLPDPAGRKAKAILAARIAELLDGIPQREAAERLGVDQPKVSKILNGQLRGFSTDRLIAFLTRLGQDVEIRVAPAPRRRTGRDTVGHVSVIAATA